MPTGYKMSAFASAIATAKQGDEWWIVKRAIGYADGKVTDERLEGPFKFEADADRRAAVIALSNGDAERERIATGKKKPGKSKPAGAASKAMMAKILNAESE